MTGLTKTLRVTYKENQVTKNLLIFKNGYSIVRINAMHHLDIDTTNTSAQVEIQGIKGNIVNSYIENIPINFLNAKHVIIIPDPENDDTHADFLGQEWTDVEGNQSEMDALRESFFFIQLPLEYTGDFLPSGYNIKLSYLTIHGIPLNEINAEFPVDINHLYGFHLVTRITDEGFAIEIPNRIALRDGNCGCSSVLVSKINGI